MDPVPPEPPPSERPPEPPIGPAPSEVSPTPSTGVNPAQGDSAVPASVPDVPIEVRPPLAPPPTLSSQYEQWLLSNLAPLGVIVVALAMMLALGPLLVKPTTIRPVVPDSPVTPLFPGMEKPMRVTWPNLGVICLVGLVLMYIFTPDARRWFKQYTPRPLPALKILDLLALLASSRAVALLLVVIAQRAQIPLLAAGSEKAILAAEMILGDAIFLAVVFLAIWLARQRVGGPHGSMGVWPFWKLVNTERSVLNDIVLGAACYPVFFLLGNLFFVPLGHELAEYFGYNPKPHPLLLALREQLQPWELVVFVLSATIGAAFFEELIFRGVLYNGLRRYVGPWLGGAAAALVFATLHPVGDWLGIFFLGMMLTWLYDKTGRLVSSMTLHFINNSVAVIATLSLEYLQRYLKK